MEAEILMEAEVFMIFKFIIGLAVVISMIITCITIFSDFSDYLIPSLKMKYTMKTEMGNCDMDKKDLEVNQRVINFYMTSIKIKIALALFCFLMLFLLFGGYTD